MSKESPRSDHTSDINGLVPLSLQQLSMISDIEILGDSSLYHIAKVLEVHTPLDKSKIKRAFFQVLKRQEALRTVFYMEKGKWFQKTDSLKANAFSFFEIEDSELYDFLDAKTAEPFDIEKGPLFFLFHIKTRSAREFLFLHMHHLISDLWSVGIFLEELFSFYNGDHLEKLPLPYFEFVDWQQKFLLTKELEYASIYWKQISQSFKGIMSSFPRDFSYTSRLRFAGEIKPFSLDRELSSEIKKLAKDQKVKPISLLLTLYAYVLFLHTGQEKLCIGTTSHGRPKARWAKTIGLFSNPVPLFLTIDLAKSFIENARNLQGILFNGLHRFQLPFSIVSDCIGDKKNPNRQPLFQNMFVYQQVPAVSGELKTLSLPSEDIQKVKWKDHELSSLDWHHPFSPFDLTLYMNELENAFTGFIEYNKNFFLEKTVNQLVLDFSDVCKFFIYNPLLSIVKYKKESPLNAIKPVEDSKTLPRMFQEVVAKAGAHIVATKGLHSLSYEALDRLSNQFARYLLDHNVYPDDFVAIQMPHSFELIVVLIGIWKIGAAFVPIDLKAPRSRVDEILKDSKPKKFIKEFDFSSLYTYSSLPIYTSCSLESIAYVIYTSGSTGKPKGVAVSQAAFKSYLLAIASSYPLDSSMCFAVYSSISFDLTLTSIFSSLVKGATIELYDSFRRVDQIFHDILNNPIITHLKCTPSHLKIFNWIGCSNSKVKVIIVGGEQLAKDLTDDVVSRFSHPLALINEYGPTETTVGCLFYFHKELDKGFSVPIGTPLENSLAYLLGPAFHLLPAHSPGSLYIGGEGVTYGYWGHPVLTAEKFIPDPFLHGKRMYQTGDLAQSDKNGLLTFLGRQDDQVKVRGHRIELGEIESKLREFHAIKDAVVIAQQTGEKNELTLVAYCAFKGENLITEAKKFLSKALPGYMVPSFFVACEAIPTTSNGKIDYKQLPTIQLCLEESNSIESYTPIEKEMIELWSEVLGIDKALINPKQSFFELGGDSIKAIQLAALTKERGWPIAVSEILELMTIQNLCSSLNMPQVADIDSYSADIQKIPLTLIQKWFFDQFDTNLHHYNQAVVLKSKTRFDLDRVRKSFLQILKSQPILCSTFPTSTEVTVHSPSYTSFGFSVYSLEKEKNAEQEYEKRKKELHGAINICKGPLIQLGVFNMPNESRLLIIIHHLIIDGVSWHILLAAFNKLYQSPLPESLFEKPSYSIFSYKKVFSASKLLKAKYPKAKKAFSVSLRKAHSFTLNKGSTKSLLKKAPFTYNCQPQDLIVSAFVLAYSKSMNTKEMTFHLEGHGRDLNNKLLDFSALIGWFTSLSLINIRALETSDLDYVIRLIKELLRSPTSQHDNHPSIVFNFLGEINTGQYESFTFEPEWSDLSHPSSLSPYSLEVNIAVVDDLLKVLVSQDQREYTTNQRFQFLNDFETSLNSIIDHCVSSQKQVLSPSDFGAQASIYEWDKFSFYLNSSLGIHLSQVEKVLPLLPSHKGLFLYSIQNPDSPIYFQQVILCFSGILEPFKIEKALDHCMQIFPALRTSFHYQGLSQPHRVVLKSRKIPLIKNVDNLEEYLIQDRNRSFDIKSDPLMRIGFKADSKNSFSLIISYHHLVLDGWSLTNFFQAFLFTLNEVNKGLPFSLKKFQPIAWNTDENESTAKLYWKGLLKNTVNPSVLPKGQPGERVDRSFCEVKHLFPKNLSHSLKMLSKERGVSLASLLHAMWAYLVFLYTDQKNVVFGTVVSGRTLKIDRVDQQVDQLSMTIPLCIEIDREVNLFHLAQEIQSQLRKSEQFLTLSTGEIQALSPLNQHLFNQLFVFENYPFSGEATELLQKSELPIKLKSAEIKEQSQYGFMISLFPGRKLGLEIQFDPEVVDKLIVENIPSDLGALIKLILNNPECKIKNLLIAGKNVSKGAISSRKVETLPEIFGKQVSKNPDSIAIVFGHKHLSYKLLDQASSQLGFDLLRAGLTSEEPVGIKIERSFEWVVAWLGILKAGGTCVPFSVDIPSERLEAIIIDIGLKFILTIDNKEEFKGAKSYIIDLKTINNQRNKTFLPNLPKVESDQLAYILYTSGSTGKPKGIAMSHKAVANHYYWVLNHFKLNASDRMLQLTAFTFDVSVCELYSIFSGGTLVLAPPKANFDTFVLTDAVERDRISFLQMVPSFLETLLSQETIKKFDSVRQVLCGADILKIQNLKQWYQYGNIPITNLYGLTETCIDSTYFNCKELLEDTKIVPIGKPIANTTAYLLNSEYDLVPLHVPGNLFIGGAGLARGYFKRPDLTAASFFPDPFSKGSRMYNTRDKGKLNRDHDLVFLGRSDNQVKIRGLRVELDEILSALEDHPEVRRAYVKVLDQELNQSICGYYSAEKEISLANWKEYLLTKLPRYMIPSFFIKVDKFPLSTHGKVVSESLPNPQRCLKKPKLVTPLEKQIASHWSAVLQINKDEIDPEQNFFDLGGNSLVMMQLQQLITKDLEKSIPITQFFSYPTIRQFALFLEGTENPSIDLNQLEERMKRKKKSRIKKHRN